MIYVFQVVDDPVVLIDKVQVFGGTDSSTTKNNEALVRKPNIVRDDNVEEEVIASNESSLESFSWSIDELKGDVEKVERDEELKEAEVDEEYQKKRKKRKDE